MLSLFLSENYHRIPFVGLYKARVNGEMVSDFHYVVNSYLLTRAV